MREYGETTVEQKAEEPESKNEDDDKEEDKTETQIDEETALDINSDEFKAYFEKTYEPKVLITTSDNPHSVIN